MITSILLDDSYSQTNRLLTRLKDKSNGYIDYFHITENDKALCAVSFSHVYGFGSGSIPYLMSGASVKFLNPFCTIRTLMKELYSGEYTCFIGLPIHYRLLAEFADKPINIRLALCAGSAVSNNILDEIPKKLGFHINNMYGMSEMGGITTLYDSITDENMYSLGHTLGEVSVKLGDVAQEDEKQPLYEIWVKSKSLAPGYFSGEDKEFHNLPLVDGWFNTNDLGYMEKDGSVCVKCRKEHMINVSGNPGEIESAMKEFPGLTDVAVLKKKDDTYGEIPTAYYTAETELDQVEMKRFLAERLPNYKMPKELHQIKEFPRSATGKILRNKIVIE